MKIQTEPLASWNYAELWNKFPIPARPCPDELALLESELKSMQRNVSEIQMLILGSTIEYRSLAKKLNIIPQVADFSRENFEALTNYSSEKFDDEIFTEADWLNLNDENKHDVILGHRAINVIEYTQLKNLFSAMYRALKPGGIFFCRGNVRFPHDADKLESIRAKWAFKKVRPYPLFTYIEVELYFHCADRYGYVDYPKARKIIDSWFNEKKISKEDYDLAYLLVSMSDEARFRGLIKQAEVIEAYTAAGFEKVEWLKCGHEFDENMPIIKLIK